jgi:signal transduction histidine kinase
LEQVRQDLLEREAMRRELMRHTVIAQEEERARIARELHDETAQVLTAFTLHLAALREALPRESRTVEQLSNLQSLSRQMSEGIYRMVHDLRPAQLDDLGLIAALQWLGDEERRRSGLEVKLRIHGQRQRLDPLVETVLFRIAQEALVNVIRHAQASQAQVQLSFEREQVRVIVQDDGCGFDAENLRASGKPAWGLLGMEERATLLGGKVEIRSAYGRGTQVSVTIPYHMGGKEVKDDYTAIAG